MTEVIAAIPHFNNPEGLHRLLDSLTTQSYAEVVILDDASHPEQRDQAEATAHCYGAAFIAGEENRGAAGNRNRVLEAGEWGGTYIHYLDSDVVVTSGDPVVKIREALRTPGVGFGGGLIHDPDGSAMAWNYGPSATVKSAIGSQVQACVAELAKSNLEAAARWRSQLGFLLRAWPDTANPQRRDTFWVAEGNLFISEKVLRGIGGFPPLRAQDINPPAIEIARRGLRAVFEPEIVVDHKPNNQTSRTAKGDLQAIGYLMKHYGIARYLFGGDNAI